MTKQRIKISGEELRKKILDGERDFQGIQLLPLKMDTYAKLSCLSGLISDDFSRSQLENTRLYHRFNFENADLRNLGGMRIELPYGDFKGADLSGCYFWNSRFDHSVFENATLDSSFFDKCNLEGAKFNDASLIEGRFSGSNLKHTSFKGADMTKSGKCMDSGFYNSDLSGANLMGLKCESLPYDPSYPLSPDFVGNKFRYTRIDPETRLFISRQRNPLVRLAKSLVKPFSKEFEVIGKK